MRNNFSAILAVVALGLSASAATAQGFSAYVSPPRIVEAVKPGSTLRQVIEIQHASASQGRYRIYTNDWSFAADQSVQFQDALSADSCRPWVAIERRDLTLLAGARYRYRIEVTPPADVAPRECRFALMIEGLDALQVAGAGGLPVGGRIAVMVYVAVGGAKPELVLGDVVRAGDSGLAIDVRNDGLAHGRLEGVVVARDAQGREVELTPADTPVLPAGRRLVSLVPTSESAVSAAQLRDLRGVLDVRGTLQGPGARLSVNTKVGP